MVAWPLYHTFADHARQRGTCCSSGVPGMVARLLSRATGTFVPVGTDPRFATHDDSMLLITVLAVRNMI